MSEQLTTDIVVVGAGLVGLSAAISLALTQKKVVLIDTQNVNLNQTSENVALETGQSAWDSRVYALTPATIIWLDSIGVWQFVDKTRLGTINQMQLWANNKVSPLTLKDNDAHLAQLGFIVENKNLLQAFWQQLNTLDVTIIRQVNCNKLDYSQPNKITLFFENAGLISAKLLIAADGVNSWVRAQTDVKVTIKAFNQTAVVANFLAEIPHHNSARQWFKSHDTLALLPLPQNMVSMVWSISSDKALELLGYTQDELADAVFKRSNGLAGRLTTMGNAHSFKLNQQTTDHLIANRIVFVGDSAHQIHPLAGQGVNLGFRDVMQLQQIFTQAHTMQDVGEYHFLRRFERNRRADIAANVALTSGLDWLFSRELGALQLGINWGFTQINKQLNIKKMLIQAATA